MSLGEDFHDDSAVCRTGYNNTDNDTKHGDDGKSRKC